MQMRWNSCYIIIIIIIYLLWTVSFCRSPASAFVYPLPLSITTHFIMLLHPIQFLRSQKSLQGWRMTHALSVWNPITSGGSVPLIVTGIQTGRGGAPGAVTYIRSLCVETPLMYVHSGGSVCSDATYCSGAAHAVDGGHILHPCRQTRLSTALLENFLEQRVIISRFTSRVLCCITASLFCLSVSFPPAPFVNNYLN